MNNDLISREALKKALQNREECKECTDEEKVDLNEVKAIAEEAEQERQQGDLISRSALLKAMEEERQYLLARGQTGAEHILVHHCLPIIDNAPTVTVEEWVKDMPLEDINLLYKALTPHGFWIRKPVERDLLYNTGIKFTCPFCGEGNSYGEPPHCMYCGARLDKEAEDANT